MAVEAAVTAAIPATDHGQSPATQITESPGNTVGGFFLDQWAIESARGERKFMEKQHTTGERADAWRSAKRSVGHIRHLQPPRADFT